MLHIDTLTQFLEMLPCPVVNKGKTRNFLIKKEWDTKSDYKKTNTTVTFVSTELMGTWKWVFVGQVIL
jgi:hypothetical protein